MLTDLPYEKVLTDVPDYKAVNHHDWMRYVQLLGFDVTKVDETAPPMGSQLYCGVIAVKDGKMISHAVAVDEQGRIFDPANGAPEPGKFTLRQCVEFGTFQIYQCYIVRHH